MSNDERDKQHQEADAIRLEKQIRDANRLRYERETQQPTTLLDYRVRNAKERRRRRGPKPKLGDELPGGGTVYADVQPVPANDVHQRGAVPYVGFDFDFRDL